MPMIMLPLSATLLPRYVFFSHVAPYIVLYRFVSWKQITPYIIIVWRNRNPFPLMVDRLDAGVWPAILNCMVLAGGELHPQSIQAQYFKYCSYSSSDTQVCGTFLLNFEWQMKRANNSHNLPISHIGTFFVSKEMSPYSLTIFLWLAFVFSS